MKCKICGSMAINHNLHGRDGSEPELCDVCFWREKFKSLFQQVSITCEIFKKHAIEKRK